MALEYFYINSSSLVETIFNIENFKDKIIFY